MVGTAGGVDDDGRPGIRTADAEPDQSLRGRIQRVAVGTALLLNDHSVVDDALVDRLGAVAVAEDSLFAVPYPRIGRTLEFHLLDRNGVTVATFVPERGTGVEGWQVYVPFARVVAVK